MICPGRVGRTPSERMNWVAHASGFTRGVFDFVVRSFYPLKRSISTAKIQTPRRRTDAWGTLRLLAYRYITQCHTILAAEEEKNRALGHPRIGNQTNSPALEKHQRRAPTAMREGFFASARAFSASARNDDVGGIFPQTARAVG
jgi:hypothetical protein